MAPTYFSRVYGCIGALAIGDAYGIIGQLTPEANQQMWPTMPDDFAAPKPDDKTVHAGMKAGEITDDTMAMLAIVKSVIKYGDLTLEGVAEGVVQWIDEVDGSNLPWVGPSTRRAVQALKDGVDPRESGHHGTTNGSSMRVAPVGLLYAPDIEKTAETAITSAYPTHASMPGTSGAAAIACAVAATVDGGATLDSMVAAAMRGADLGAAAGVYNVSPSISRRIEWAVDIVSSDRSEHDRLRDIYDFIGTSMQTHETVPAAMAFLVMSEGDPMRAIRLATQAAGDCDTTAAIAGAMAGAYSGVEALPDNMLQTIGEVNNLNLEKTARDFIVVIEKINPTAKS